MENNIIVVLNKFANDLSSISPRGISNMKIVLPYDNYRQLEWEFCKLGTYMNLGKIPSSSLTLNTSSGITFDISCKEIEDNAIREKLSKCFDILSDKKK